MLPLLLALLQASAVNKEPVVTALGKGVQIYACTAAKGWVFQAPEATLYQGGDVVGKHSAGPLWTWADGSAITGKVIMSTAAPDPTKDIPWLILGVIAVPGGTGVLSTVVTVKRTDTHGGVAPDGGCDAAHVGDLARVPYSATYSFYGFKGGI